MLQPQWTWRTFGQTDRGLVRATNQDALLVDDQHRLWAVADGMGGHAGGDVASRLVIDTVARLGSTLVPESADGRLLLPQVIGRITELIAHAHRAILTHVDHHPSLRGMGTTLALAHFLPISPPRLIIANVGDSRAYLLRPSAITQVTRDHTLVEEYLRDGLLTPAQAATHPDRHVLTRAMGQGLTVQCDTFIHDVQPGDLLLLCSDGLTKMLDDERILDLASPHLDQPSHTVAALIQAALTAGGIDNVTVVACRFSESHAPDK